ncbi:MAG: TonB-dependent receptor [Hyphomonadaceae bacterium]
MKRKGSVPARGGNARTLTNLALGIVAAGGAIGVASPALAQEAEADSGSASEAIVVTATRREQAIQDVPIAVSAYNAEALDQQNIVSTQDLARIAPSLTIQSSNSETGGSTLRIRGVGTTGNNIGLEGAVGIFIDGVYRQRAGLALNNLFDVQRIEVLRGPQGTLFGKNTSAGALAVIPNYPRIGNFQASAEMGFSEFDGMDFTGMLNVPIGDEFAVRVAGTMQVRDGYMQDTRTDEVSFDRDRDLIRVQGLWEPNDDISWRVSLDWSQKDENCCQAAYRFVSPAVQANFGLSLLAPPAAGFQPFTYDFTNTIGVPTLEHTDEWGFGNYFDWDLGGATLRTIIAHRNFTSENSLDADFGPSDIVRQSFPAEQTLDSFEATLSGSAGNLDWLVGAYYAQEEIDQTVSTIYGTQTGAFVALLSGAIPGGPLPAAAGCGADGADVDTIGDFPCYPAFGGSISNEFFQESTTWSLFTHNTFNFSDQFSATLGLRLNNEEKEGGGRNFNVNSPSCLATPASHPIWASPFAAGIRTLCDRPDYTGRIDEQEWTGIFSLNWSPTDDIMLYASYSHGYKAGGINLDRDATVRPVVGPVLPDGTIIGSQDAINAASTFLPEFSDSYELGIRTQWFDRQLTLNLTAFWTDYTDFQLNTFTGLGFIISNPGSVESRGVELESRWTPNDRFSMGLNASWIDAVYGNDPGLSVDPDGAGILLPLAGRQLTNAPEWTVSGNIHVEQPLWEGVRGFVDLSARYRSEYNTGSDLDPRKFQDAFTTVGARIGLTGDDDSGSWDVYLWGDNITDEEVHVISFNSVFQSGGISTFPGAPAMWGITLRRRFD